MNIAISPSVDIVKCNKVERINNPISKSLIKYSNKTAHIVYREKQPLFSAGDSFKGVYQLLSGSAKTSITSVQGQELITQFYLPGDLMGIDGFNQHSHSQNVRFLETSGVIFFSLKEVNHMLAESEVFRTNLLMSMSQSLMREQQMLLNYKHLNSVQRVAYFLLTLTDNFKQPGYSNSTFRLPMTRSELANYLCMAIETLSRILSRFQKSNILKINNRIIEIKNWRKLTHLAE